MLLLLIDSNCKTVGIITEKIVNLARHFNIHKKDHSSYRGFKVSFSVLFGRALIAYNLGACSTTKEANAPSEED